MDFNKVILGGRLTRDPELRHTNDGIPVANFGLAVNRVKSKQDAVDFVEVTAWRKQAELIEEYFSKGSRILLDGELRYRSWEAQDGSKRSAMSVEINDFQFVDTKAESEARSGDGSSAGGEEDFDDLDF